MAWQFPWTSTVSSARLFLLMLASTAAGSVFAQEARELSVLNIKFCGKEQAAKQLIVDDDFTAAVSRFDLQVRLQSAADVTLEDLKERIAESTLDWNEVEQAKLQKVIDDIAPRTRSWRIPWPDTVWLAKTTGREDADAPYTRGTTIVLPERILKNDHQALVTLLIHELFHVLSRNSREFREHTYAVIGFRLTNEIPVPQTLQKRRITNPDAPRIDCYQIIREGTSEVAVTPILFSRNDFDPRVGGNLFKSMEFKLMRLKETPNGWRPAEGGAKPMLLDPKEVADFHTQIGKNTKYIIHPDEVLADNFVHLILQEEKLPSPEIIAGMRNVVQLPE